jgi:hypothetical protein
MMERNRDEPLSDSQARAVSMLIYENPKKSEDKVKGLVKWGLTEFATTATLGKRIASLQPFADKASVPAIPPALSMLMGGPDPASELPLVLLRDYSNEDKHRTIRLAAGAGRRTGRDRLQQRHDRYRLRRAGPIGRPGCTA